MRPPRARAGRCRGSSRAETSRRRLATGGAPGPAVCPRTAFPRPPRYRSRVRRRAVPIGFLVVLLAAGCGGSAKPLTRAQYEHHLQADGKAIEHDAAALVTARTPTGLAQRIAQEQAELRRAADDLASLDPPVDAVRDNARIAS